MIYMLTRKKNKEKKRIIFKKKLLGEKFVKVMLPFMLIDVFFLYLWFSMAPIRCVYTHPS